MWPSKVRPPLALADDREPVTILELEREIEGPELFFGPAEGHPGIG
jgi:hypothetical protein